jgi:hydrophobe/amphiphile efflux-1 (HAE1) family protein
VLLAIGYTINLITLFGLILAIGIVVDDAILVIENVNRLMNEEKLSPRDAAIKTMEQVTGPIVATTLVLLAMFIPTCFLPGITGEMYRQFGITISVAVLISAVNALTLSPSLSALLLRPIRQGQKKWFPFRWFDFGFDKLTGGYTILVGSLCRKAVIIFVLYLGMTLFSGKLYQQLPSAFMPNEDQGAFFVNVQLPDGSALSRTQKVVEKIIGIIKETPGVTDVITSAGYSILTGTNASNSAMVIVILEDWSKRRTPELQVNALMAGLRGKFFQIPEAMCIPFAPATIPGLGNTGGFSFVLQDTTGTHPQRLADVTNSLIVAANNNPLLTGVFSTFSASVPQVFLKIDREKALKMGVPLQSINDALKGMLGYAYINDFNKFGRVYKVEIQAESKFRSNFNGIGSIHLKNNKGEMVPLDTLVEISTKFGPQFINRYNLYSSVTINGSPAPGCSSGQAMKAMETIAAQKLPPGMKFDWTDLSYQERLASGKVAIVFVLALTFIYLFLVAQYESWLTPFSVLLSVPVAFLGAICSLLLLRLDNNIYTQVGLVLLFGIATKTAILIVEFAKELCDRENMSPLNAAIHAAKLRFRAVIMTGVSFILGVLPLVISEGAGSAGRRSLGTVIFGGMIVACIVGTILIPVFFVVFQTVINWSKKPVCSKPAAAPAPVTENAKT